MKSLQDTLQYNRCAILAGHSLGVTGSNPLLSPRFYAKCAIRDAFDLDSVFAVDDAIFDLVIIQRNRDITLNQGIQHG